MTGPRYVSAPGGPSAVPSRPRENVPVCPLHQRIPESGKFLVLGLIPSPPPTLWLVSFIFFGFSCDDVENVVSGFLNKGDN